MTLIITHINRFGIIHASDSNLTSSDQDAGEVTKTYKIVFLKAGLTTAGSYRVNNVPMPEWMTDFIDKQSKITELTLKDFSHNLKHALQETMLKEEKENGSMIHIAGYVEEQGLYHPEFWFISNVHGIDPKTGEYEDIDENFAISEDFWNRDYRNNNLKETFQDPNQYSYQIYVNGLAPGRIGFNIIRTQLDRFFSSFWNVRDWKFRPPKTLKETKLYVEIYMQVINSLFIMSDYNARYIGGKTQTLLIPQPENIVDKKS